MSIMFACRPIAAAVARCWRAKVLPRQGARVYCANFAPTLTAVDWLASTQARVAQPARPATLERALIMMATTVIMIITGARHSALIAAAAGRAAAATRAPGPGCAASCVLPEMEINYNLADHQHALAYARPVFVCAGSRSLFVDASWRFAQFGRAKRDVNLGARAVIASHGCQWFPHESESEFKLEFELELEMGPKRGLATSTRLG